MEEAAGGPKPAYLLTMEFGDVALEVILLLPAGAVVLAAGAGSGAAEAALVFRAGLTGVGGSTAAVGCC